MAWIDNLFRIMQEKKASDLHMTSEHVPMIRESGDMVPLPGVPKLTREQMQQILMEICPDRNKKQFEETWDTDFAYALEGLRNEIWQHQHRIATDLGLGSGRARQRLGAFQGNLSEVER